MALPTLTHKLPDSTRLGRAHLKVTNFERAAAVWRDLVGLSILSRDRDSMEMGVGSRVLLAFCASARDEASEASLGLHHVALHIPSDKEFARVAARLGTVGRSFRAVDRTVAKAIYLSDDDGIGIELVLETPHRGRLEVVGGGLRAVSVGGEIHPAALPLDLRPMVGDFIDAAGLAHPLPGGTELGHIHLRVRDLDLTNRFYADTIGFLPLLQVPAFGMYDVGTATRPHLVAFSNWTAADAPDASAAMAGLKWFTISVPSPDVIEGVAGRLAAGGIRFLESTNAVQANDPDGNSIIVTCDD
nr:VOC family protein [Bradyrhizobium hipponense]